MRNGKIHLLFFEGGIQTYYNFLHPLMILNSYNYMRFFPKSIIVSNIANLRIITT